MIWDPTMGITTEERQTVVNGIAEDGTISKEAEAVLRKRIDEGKAANYPMGEVKRQFRADLDAEPGKKVADAIDKLW